MTERIRWGIIGAGNIAKSFANDLPHTETGVLAAIASRTVDRANAFAARHPSCQVFGNYQEMVNSDAVDAIYVATPNSLHCEHALLAIEAGKPVLVEKPFATSATEAEKIADAAQSHGVFCMEALWTRFLPTMVDIRNKVTDGELGPIRQLHVSLGFPRIARAGDPITDPALGGGALTDLGVYGVTIAHYLLGASTCISAAVTHNDLGSAREVTMLLRHGNAEDAPLSTISVSHGTELSNTLSLFGADGKVWTDAPFIQCRRAWQGRVHATDPSQSAQQPSGMKAMLQKTRLWPAIRQIGKAVVPSGHKQFGTGFPGTGLHFQADEVGRCLRNGRYQSELMPLDQSVAVIRQLDDVRRLTAND